MACALTLFAASTDATVVAEETSTRPARENSLSTETIEVLEKRLAQRPDRQELQDRNILRGAPAQAKLFERGFHCDYSVDGSVAPALQAARDQLQRSQLEVRAKTTTIDALIIDDRSTRTCWIRNLCRGPGQRNL